MTKKDMKNLNTDSVISDYSSERGSNNFSSSRKNRRTRNRRKRHGNSRYAVLFLFIIFGLVIAGFTAKHLLGRMSFFTIQQIVIAGNVNLNSSFLEELAQENIGQNLFQISKSAIEGRYDNIVRIKEMTVTRTLPNKLKISIKEREGFVYIKTKEGILIPVDQEMTILDNRGFYLAEDLPVIHSSIAITDLVPGERIVDEMIREICSFHTSLIASTINEKNVSEYYIKDNSLVIVEAQTGSRISLGSDSYTEKIEKLEFVWQNVGIEKESQLDFRFKNQVVISRL